MSLDSYESAMPDLYANWLTTLLGPLPSETRATCANCAMCIADDGQRPAAAYPFEPDVRCCVYLPQLPSFLVGGILQDNEYAPASALLEERIAQRVGVTPLGIGSTPRHDFLFQNTVNAVGRSHALRCPYFVEDGFVCGIYPYRNHLCATYFCKHDRGQTGFVFWHAAKQLLQAVEEDLAKWCALQLDLSPSALSLLVRESQPPTDSGEIDGQMAPAVYASFWGNWYGREKEYYQQCQRLVAPLDWSTVLSICGPKVPMLAKITELALANVNLHGFPTKLRAGSYQLLGVNSEGISAITYASTDPVGIPHTVLSVL
ncbi:MAG: hypothetical protein HN348_23065, partial [Proteobacteria bacterium]|nr:hypothetical protein [Pseudomonadota bacterium]